MAAALRIEQPKQVLVEGNDDMRLFRALAKHLSILDTQVHPYEGTGNLRSFLKTFRALSGFASVKSLAVVADANSDRNRAGQRIRGALSAANFPSPRGPLKALSQGSVRVCYLVVPHEAESGMIEDVCLDSVKSDPAVDCVDRYFECLRETNRVPKDSWLAKARLHAYLASRERPDLRLGETAEKGIWDFEADVFRPLKDLLELL